MVAFLGGTVILPDCLLENSAVLVENGKIFDIVSAEKIPDSAEVINLNGGYLSPGFIDMHLHGGGGFDFMDGDSEEFKQIAKMHLSHGTTAMCPTTMTSGNEDLFACFSAYKKAKSEGTGGAEFLGLHLEGPYISTASKGAQPEGSARFPTAKETELILKEADGNIIRWDAAPELPGADTLAKMLRDKNMVLSIAHSAATAEETLSAYEKGFTHITHMYCATTTEHKVGQTVHGGIIEAAYLEDGITVELIADGKHIPKETMSLGFKLKNGKLALVTDAMRAAGTDVTESILGSRKNGTKVIVEEGVAKLPDRTSFAGSIGTMDNALRIVHKNYGVPLEDTVKAMSLTPAEILGVDSRKGSIEKGKDADLLILTQDFTVQKAYVKGECLYSK